MHHSIESGDAYDSDIMDGSGNEGQCDLRRRWGKVYVVMTTGIEIFQVD